MKTTSTLFTALGLLSAATLTASAETAYTPPVMAASTELGAEYSVLGINALNPIEATGVIDSIGSVDGNGFTTLNVSNVPSEWATHDYDNQGGVVEFNFRDVPLYYAEITSGDKEGQILDIVATGAGSGATLKVGADLTGMDAAFENSTFSIRRKHTIASVFGENNETGLQGGPDYKTSDIIYNLFGEDFENIYYQDADGDAFDGWRILGDPFTDVSDACVDPDFGLIVYRRGTTPINYVSVGDVKLGEARSTISRGYNPMIMKFPVSMTLGSCGLSEVLDAGAEYKTADLVYLLDGTDFYTYYYQDADGDAFDGWRLIGDPFTEQSSVDIPSGSVVIVYRRSENPVIWTKEQPFVIE